MEPVFKGFPLHSRPGNADLLPAETGEGPQLKHERCAMETITDGLVPTREAVIPSFS